MHDFEFSDYCLWHSTNIMQNAGKLQLFESKRGTVA